MLVCHRRHRSQTFRSTYAGTVPAVKTSLAVSLFKGDYIMTSGGCTAAFTVATSDAPGDVTNLTWTCPLGAGGAVAAPRKVTLTAQAPAVAFDKDGDPVGPLQPGAVPAPVSTAEPTAAASVPTVTPPAAGLPIVPPPAASLPAVQPPAVDLPAVPGGGPVAQAVTTGAAAAADP